MRFLPRAPTILEPAQSPFGLPAGPRNRVYFLWTWDSPSSDSPNPLSSGIPGRPICLSLALHRRRATALSGAFWPGFLSIKSTMARNAYARPDGPHRTLPVTVRYGFRFQPL